MFKWYAPLVLGMSLGISGWAELVWVEPLAAEMNEPEVRTRQDPVPDVPPEVEALPRPLPPPAIPTYPRPQASPRYYTPQPYAVPSRGVQKPFATQKPLAYQKADSVQKPYAYQKSYPIQRAYQKSAVCCPDYCVKYIPHGRFRKSCCGCCVPVSLYTSVPDPLRCGCAVDLCLTVPGCLEGTPCVREKIGLLGRGIVRMTWPCGFEVEVVFKKKVPDVLVHTFAR